MEPDNTEPKQEDVQRVEPRVQPVVIRTSTVKETVMVPMDLWLCNNPNHHHKSQRVAQDCIENEVRKNKNKPHLSRDEYRIRNIEATRYWINGATYKETGERIGVTPERFRQISANIIRNSRRLEGLPIEPDGNFATKTWSKERRNHYLLRVGALAAHWGV